MISKRIQELTPFIAMDVLEKAHSMEREGVHIIHLEIGEPDFDTPACIKDAAIRALNAGHTHYTHSLGLVELGDKVIVSDPHYACYPNFIRFAGGEPITIPVYEDDGFQYRPEAIREKLDDTTKAVFINSPSNPTGNILSHERMQVIAGLAPYVISDEIYHGLVYEGEEHSILEYTDRAFVLNGFSKVYAMTGWRLGYLIAPVPFVRAIQKMHQNFFISANA
ncbi:MAG: aminotransferase class I/II-fold pyridoxal phosphate-dependent enzyme, partial [Deltaproteobacteria bacterium]|nr:aminotransferase class I/II-fold pyridoxal phosphate-dependent enzyme [Deltaproteobacteria bacterium]